MASSVNLKAFGLNTSQNQLEAPAGSLIQAENIIIRRENVIESRRGIKLYADSIGTTSDRAKQIIDYKDRLIRHYSNKLQYDNGDNTFSTFNGDYTETDLSPRIKSIESNGNLYFTTTEGIKKLSARTAADFSTSPGLIQNAGGVKAVDVTSYLNPNTTSPTWFLTDSVVAYRIVWGYKDLNENLILGSPSERSIVYNSLLSSLIRDYMQVLGSLDDINQTGSLINDGNYIDTLKLPINTTAEDLRSNLITLATKLDTDIYLANDPGTGVPLNISNAGTGISAGIATIKFSGSPTLTDYFAIGDKIYLTGWSGPLLNGINTITDVDDTADEIQFLTTETSVTSLGDIYSGTFRAITEPPVLSQIPTHDEIDSLRIYLQTIIEKLQLLHPGIVSAPLVTTYLDPLDITISYTNKLEITIPSEITTNYFYQIYRSTMLTAIGTDVFTDLVPNDELRLVFEANPTSTEITTGVVIVEDVTPDEFAGANLYTNPSSGEGILQSNDLPPFAKDIAKFKDVTFYSNTRTRNRLQVQLLGVASMVEQYGLGNIPKLTITDGVTTNTYSFVVGAIEETTFTCVAKASIAASAYFTINNAYDRSKYYFWYDTTGSDVDPAVAGRFGVKIDISDVAIVTASDVAYRTMDVVSRYVDDFNVTNVTNTVTIANTSVGSSDDATIGTTTFGISIIQGVGEGGFNILLSDLISPAQAVDATIRSLVRILNLNSSETVYAFNISSTEGLPGKILLESKSLNNDPFYLLTDKTTTGASFSPDLSPTLTISSATAASPTLVTTTTPHGLVTGNEIVISNSNSTPSIDGLYPITFVSSTSFTIPVAVTVAGTTGSAAPAILTNISENEERSNRVYYSKLQQPEAVPILNYFDVGSKDRIILRIVPLRDSLFIFKEDGVYRVSGEIAPFNISLFDNTIHLLATDSPVVMDSHIIAWTDDGIVNVSEGGSTLISRPIDIDTIRIQSLPNFITSTFSIAYHSDNSIIIFTNKQASDEVATFAYRFSVITNTWTTYEHSSTCGLVKHIDDKLYLGAGDVNSLEVERKTFTRKDYADREYAKSIGTLSYQDNKISFPSASNISVGDVIVQSQTVTNYLFNVLLKKLDLDSKLTDVDYYSTLKVENGEALNLKIDSLIAKVRDDAGRLATPGFTASATYTALLPTPSTFDGMQTTYNDFIDLLNLDIGIGFSDYRTVDITTDMETVITAVDTAQKKVTLQYKEAFIEGPVTIYKSIPTKLTYTAQSMGDPLSLKHFFEATVMVEARTFTNATLSFATDLLPSFESITFNGSGSGGFGISNPFGENFFGGLSNAAPLRTIIPRTKQRCRYILAKFEHSTAFEKYAILGTTLTGNVTSIRGYR